MTRILQLRIPGDWADCWLYKEQVFLWSETGELISISQARLANQLGLISPRLRLAAELLIFRNDWKVGEQRTAYSRLDGFSALVDVAVDEAISRGPVSLNLDQATMVDVEPVPGDLLSTAVFANHAFLATSNGLFETNVNPRFLDRSVELIERLAVPAHFVHADYGAVAVSAFEEGLWFDTIDLADPTGWLSGGPMDRIAEYSRRTATVTRDLLNYTEEPIPELWTANADREYQSARSRYRSWQVKSYQRSDANLSRIADTVRSPDTEGPAPRVLANANYRLLIDHDDSLYVVQVGDIRTGRIRDISSWGTESAQFAGDTISANPLSSGFAVETDRAVHLLNELGVVELVSLPSAAVRTFPASRRHKDVLATIHEDHALLTGIW